MSGTETTQESTKMSLRDIVNQKREAKALEAQRQLTFKPALLAKQSALSYASGESVFTKLYEAKKHAEDAAAAAAAVCEHVTEEPNQPKYASKESINRLHYGLGACSRNPVSAAAVAAHSEETAILTALPSSPKPQPAAQTHHLYEGAEKLRQKLEQKKAEQEELVSAQCPFKPNIMKKMESGMDLAGNETGNAGASPAGSEQQRSDAKPVAVFDRLASTQKVYVYDVDAILKQRTCTFQPQVTELAATIRTKGLVHDRLNAEAEQIKVEAKKREEIRQKNEMIGVTFCPSIPENSAELAKKKKVLGTVVIGEKEKNGKESEVVSCSSSDEDNAGPTASPVGHVSVFDRLSTPTEKMESESPATTSCKKPIDKDAEGIVTMEQLLADKGGLHVIGNAMNIPSVTVSNNEFTPVKA